MFQRDYRKCKWIFFFFWGSEYDQDVLCEIPKINVNILHILFLFPIGSVSLIMPKCSCGCTDISEILPQVKR